LTTRVTTHAVRDDNKAAFANELIVVLRLRIAVIILVLGTMATYIGKIAQLDAGTDFHARLRRWLFRQRFRGAI
jgi:hypothetical protein